MVVAGLDPANPLAVSVRTGAGLDDLKRAALALLAPGWDRRERPLVTRLRQQGCLQRAVRALTEARELAASGAGEELIVVPLGDVLTALAALTGRGDLEEVYDRVFSSFCIGK
jgi:tRNA modification GTPase